MLQAALSAVTQKAWLSLGKSEGERLCPCGVFRDSQIQIQKASKTPKVDENLRKKKRPNKPKHIGFGVTSLKRSHVTCLGWLRTFSWWLGKVASLPSTPAGLQRASPAFGLFSRPGNLLLSRSKLQSISVAQIPNRPGVGSLLSPLRRWLAAVLRTRRQEAPAGAGHDFPGCLWSC